MPHPTDASMPIQFECENCQKKLKVPESAAGKRGRCNQCGHLNTIPAVASAEPIIDTAAVNDGAGAPVAQPTGSGSGAETYNVKSAVNGAVFGPADAATLQGWLEEGRITPNCQLQKTGTQGWTMASAMFPALGAAAAGVASAATGSSGDQFSQFAQAPASKAGELNPYAPGASTPAASPLWGGREIVPTTGDISFCISHGWKIWTENFGLLLAVSATVLVVNYAFQILQGLLQAGLAVAPDPWLIGAGLVLIILVSIVIQLWLGLGNIDLICRLCRGERAEYSMLFGRIGRTPAALLFMFLAYLPFIVVGGGLFMLIGPDGFQPGNNGATAITLIVPLLAMFAAIIVLALTCWPIFFLLAHSDMKFGFELVRKGFSIGLKNFFVVIPIFFVAGLVGGMGIFACGVGLIATIPAAHAIMCTAFLNMSGQLRPR